MVKAESILLYKQRAFIAAAQLEKLPSLDFIMISVNINLTKKVLKCYSLLNFPAYCIKNKLQRFNKCFVELLIIINILV